MIQSHLKIKGNYLVKLRLKIKGNCSVKLHLKIYGNFSIKFNLKIHGNCFCRNNDCKYAHLVYQISSCGKTFCLNYQFFILSRKILTKHFWQKKKKNGKKPPAPP